MRRSRAMVGSAAFFVVAPGTVVGLIPWLITHWRFHEPLPHWVIAQVMGMALICAGLVPTASAFIEFVRSSRTPSWPPVVIARRSGMNVGPATGELNLGEAATWISVEQLEHVLDFAMERPAVRLSFDGGHCSDVHIVLPRLVERGLIAEFFPSLDGSATRVDAWLQPRTSLQSDVTPERVHLLTEGQTRLWPLHTLRLGKRLT